MFFLIVFIVFNLLLPLLLCLSIPKVFLQFLRFFFLISFFYSIFFVALWTIGFAEHAILVWVLETNLIVLFACVSDQRVLSKLFFFFVLCLELFVFSFFGHLIFLCFLFRRWKSVFLHAIILNLFFFPSKRWVFFLISTIFL